LNLSQSKGNVVDKTIAGLLGSASALALIGYTTPLSAAPVGALQPAQTYAELLDPIPDAAEVLKDRSQHTASIELAQYYYGNGGPYYHHHHHHHHHQTYYYGYAPYPRHHHHHHQHIVIPVPLPGY
jgi:hypothetical protein